jgi:hypothetical protein
VDVFPNIISISMTSTISPTGGRGVFIDYTNALIIMVFIDILSEPWKRIRSLFRGGLQAEEGNALQADAAEPESPDPTVFVAEKIENQRPGGKLVLDDRPQR